MLNVSTSCLGTFGVLIFYLCCKERVLGHMVRILVEPSAMGQRLYVFVVCFFLVIIFLVVFGDLFVQIFLSADAAHHFFLVSGCCVILLVRKHIPLESWPIFRPIFLNNILTNISTRISF